MALLIDKAIVKKGFTLCSFRAFWTAALKVFGHRWGDSPTLRPRLSTCDFADPSPPHGLDYLGRGV